MNSKLISLTLFFILILSCAKDKKESNNEETINFEKIVNTVSLKNTSWLVTKLKGQSDFSRNPTVHIDNIGNRISGSTGCNRYFGDVLIDETQFFMNNIGSTKMMCDKMEIEQLFFEALNQVATYKTDGKTLSLMSEKQEVLIECNLLENTNN